MNHLVLTVVIDGDVYQFHETRKAGESDAKVEGRALKAAGSFAASGDFVKVESVSWEWS